IEKRKDLELVRKVQGGALTTVCHYNEHNYSQREKFWCKERCQPVVSVEIDKIVNTQGRTRIQTDMRYRVIIVTLVVLQLRDSGEYHCETHLQGSTAGNLLSQLTLIVVHVISHSWYSEVNFNVLCIMAGLLGTKFLTALLIFIITSHRRSKATEQEIHSRNKHQLLPLTGNLTECIRGGINPS
uniref:Immunoglobulin V-set domain-containing protein n=1 Tax=Chelydra serpentina TaxID=8475 RepID=A0A8C3XNG7_CHESE